MTNQTVILNYKNFYVEKESIEKIKNLISDIKYHDHSLDSGEEKNYRYCELAFPSHYSYYPEIFDMIDGYFNHINNDYFQFDLSGKIEIQVLRYNIGGKYKWHCDYGNHGDDASVRKLSMSLQLSEPSEYDGGNLELIDMYGHFLKIDKEIGSAMMFTSKTPHMAHPVTKGTRLVLVAWAHGPQFK